MKVVIFQDRDIDQLSKKVNEFLATKPKLLFPPLQSQSENGPPVTISFFVEEVIRKTR